jgi:hypothetical protein
MWVAFLWSLSTIESPFLSLLSRALRRIINSMPTFLNNPSHWHLRAQEVRLLVGQLEDSEAKQATLKIAEEYERLAVRAAKRLQQSDK